MAILKDLIVSGSSRLLGKLYTNDIEIGNDLTVTGVTTTTRLIISSTNNPGTLSSTNSSTGNIPLIIGSPTGKHIAIDGDEIAAKNGVTTGAYLYLNYGGSRVYLSNGSQIYADNGKFTSPTYLGTNIGTSTAYFTSGYITTAAITTANTNTINNADMITTSALDVKGKLHAVEYDLENIMDLGGSFVVAPTLIVPSSGSGTKSLTVTKSNNTTVVMAVRDPSIVSGGIAGFAWANNYKVKVSGLINNTVLGTCDGYINSTNVGSNTISLTVTMDAETVTAIATTVSNYKLNIMLYNTDTSSATAVTKPLGIYLQHYQLTNNPIINVWNGQTTTPKVRIGYLGGITYNGSSLGTNAQNSWGLYSDSVFLEGQIIANGGKIGGFNITTNAIYSTTNALGTTANNVYVGTEGISLGTTFKITKAGVLNATDATITGSITAKSFSALDTNQKERATVNTNGFIVKDASGNTVASLSNDLIIGQEAADLYNIKIDADTGVLIRKNATTLASYGSDIKFYDGSGDATTNIAAQFTSSGAVIGKSTESHIELDYHSLRLIDKSSAEYFSVRDLRGENGYADIEESFIGDGQTTDFKLNLYPSVLQVTPPSDATLTVTVLDTNDTDVSSSYTYTYFLSNVGYIVRLSPAPTNNYLITVKYQTSSSYAKSFTFGDRISNSMDLGGYSSSFGSLNKASGTYSFSHGKSNKALGYCSYSSGENVAAQGYCSNAFGYTTASNGKYSHAEGYYSIANGDSSHAEGYYTIANGVDSHAEGINTITSNAGSHAEGYGQSSQIKVTASGIGSHAEGYAYWRGTEAFGAGSHAEGCDTMAKGIYSHAEGYFTTASGNSSHAQNYYTIATEPYQTVIGKYNSATRSGDGTSSSPYTYTNTGDYAFIIGNGTGDETANRSNALTVDWSGNLTCNNVGAFYQQSTVVSTKISQANINHYDSGSYVDLPAGTYVLNATWIFQQGSSTGARNLEVRITNESGTVINDGRTRVYAANRNYAILQATAIAELAGGKYYVQASSDVTTTENGNTYIRAVRIK